MSKLDIRKIRGNAYRDSNLKKKDLKRHYQSVRMFQSYYGRSFKQLVVEKKWITDAGLLAVVVMTYMGHRCGYVAVGPKSELLDRENSFDSFGDINVHGGVTFHRQDKTYPIWNKELLWIGFDCAHFGDAPADGHPYRNRWHTGGIHRDLQFCIENCEQMAAQIVKL